MSEYDVEPGQPWSIERFAPEDAEGVTRLFRLIYGDGYPNKVYLDPEALRQANAEGRVLSSVARTPKGEIVGHNALFPSAPGKTIRESGAGLVHPSYSGGKGIFAQLGDHGSTYGPDLGIYALFGEPVMHHPYAQKAMNNVGWTTYALEVDLMPAEAYAKHADAKGRVSVSQIFKILVPLSLNIQVPEPYKEQFEELYAPLEDPRTFEPATSPLETGPSGCVTQVYPDAQVARIAIHRMGGDFGAMIDREFTQAEAQGVKVFQVWLPLTKPGLMPAVDALRERGYFFGGVLPRWFDEDGMLMQKMTHRPHWEQMVIALDRVQTIHDLVKADWERNAK